MKLQIMSDLHLEAHPHFAPEPAPDADVLVLAGDIGSYQNGSLLLGSACVAGKEGTADADFGLARFSPLPQYGAWPTPVILVPGNHEYDAHDWDTAHLRLQRTCERLGIVMLERASTLFQGVRFVGTTLWSDFDALADHDGETDLTQRLRRREKSFRAANFYLHKTGTTQSGIPYLAEQIREKALVCQRWLRQELSQPFDGATVVITHFAPSLRSADPRYGLVPGTAGFCNALDDLLPYAQLWIHGHLHTPVDYTAQGITPHNKAWRCRVVANPLGYVRKNEQAAFKPHFCAAV
jgi:predicted phosphodiesterase